MTTYIPISATGLGARVTMTGFDSLLVGSAVTLGSTDTFAIAVQGQQNDLRIFGTVAAFSAAIYCEVGSTNTKIYVANTGHLENVTATSAGLWMAGTGSVRNEGLISGYNGINLENAIAASNPIVNYGTIEGKSDVGINIYSGSASTSSLTNYGTVRGLGAYSSIGTGSDEITNFGSLIGEVFLGGGNDSYAGAAGRLIGKLYGGDGDDKVIGGAGNDWFEGENQNDTLIGNGGVDTLNGDTGIDTINGGTGRDKLYGGANNDTFIFNVAPTAANRDTIYDFNLGNDTIKLENAFFTKVGSTGPLKAAAFKLSTQTKDADDRIIYNKTTGQLFYDSDGSGAAAAVHFATLQNKPTVTAADFAVI